MLAARRHDISRLEAFSDAVFAFALTLLVMSRDVPSSYEARHRRALAARLSTGVEQV